MAEPLHRRTEPLAAAVYAVRLLGDLSYLPVFAARPPDGSLAPGGGRGQPAGLLVFEMVWAAQ